MKTLQLVVAEYMYSDEVASKAKGSRKRTERVLRWLKETAGATTPIARVSRSNVDATMARCRLTANENTLNGYRSCLRGFGSFAHTLGYTKTNIAAHLKTQKTTPDARKRKPLSAAQATKILEVAASRHPRDFYTCLLLLTTGLREGEVAGLKWENVDLESMTLTVWRPKIRDWHRVPVSMQLAEAMTVWREWVISRHGPVQGAWRVVPALAYRGGDVAKMYPGWALRPEAPQTNIRDRVKSWMRAIGETELHGRGTHTLRRSAANLLIEAGADIRVVQSLLGHSSVAMTEKYLDRNVAAEKLRDHMKDFRI